ncbi:hypothetical protein C8F04DRAFT_1174757 [Mycena alexandri]|uniref:Uncharacterized protein n=1 Tax=Mycena alexandri TaxID=1745969 RepID=A0AAD6TI48_9AGAR|nr:hypothetical protein C8F04DRAFT_1174757 [Mycena alexandri]
MCRVNAASMPRQCAPVRAAPRHFLQTGRIDAECNAGCAGVGKWLGWCQSEVGRKELYFSKEGRGRKKGEVGDGWGHSAGVFRSKPVKAIKTGQSATILGILEAQSQGFTGWYKSQARGISNQTTFCSRIITIADGAKIKTGRISFPTSQNQIGLLRIGKNESEPSFRVKKNDALEFITLLSDYHHSTVKDREDDSNNIHKNVKLSDSFPSWFAGESFIYSAGAGCGSTGGMSWHATTFSNYPYLVWNRLIIAP